MEEESTRMGNIKIGRLQLLKLRFSDSILRGFWWIITGFLTGFWLVFDGLFAGSWCVLEV